MIEKELKMPFSAQLNELDTEIYGYRANNLIFVPIISSARCFYTFISGDYILAKTFKSLEKQFIKLSGGAQ